MDIFKERVAELHPLQCLFLKKGFLRSNTFPLHLHQALSIMDYSERQNPTITSVAILDPGM